MKLARPVALSVLLLAGACVQKRDTAPPQPEPAVQPRPAPPAVQPPAAVPPNWSDMALTPGNWSYRSDAAGSQASFGSASSDGRLSLRCDRSQRRVILLREGAAADGRLSIRTSFGARDVAATVDAEPPTSRASFAAADSFLDSIVFSRGRFTVEAPGLPILVIPTWPEPARVVEDCRG